MCVRLWYASKQWIPLKSPTGLYPSAAQLQDLSGRRTRASLGTRKEKQGDVQEDFSNDSVNCVWEKEIRDGEKHDKADKYIFLKDCI